MRIVELRGASHVYTLNDGSTFRILAHSTVEIADELISDEMRRAEKLRILRFIKKAKKTVTVQNVSETTTNSGDGSDKKKTKTTSGGEK